ncbi:MAG: ABC transporter family substrate-binding protein [Pseudonocardia sp.]
MSRVRSVRRLGVLVLAAALALTAVGCSGADDAGAPPPATRGGNDVNPKPREALRDGGDLRWPIDSIPDNLNANHRNGIDGPTVDIVGALLPTMFRGTADGGTTLNTDLLDSAEVTGTNPQVVTYRLNPRARWSDGLPITWRDFEAQWKALRGTEPAYQAAGKTGYEDIASVARGRDDKHAVVTFARTFAEWRSLFSPLYPERTNSDPVAFNTAWVNAVPVSGGPFALEGIDPAAGTVALRRNERWWGAPPRLSRIVFRVHPRAELADALAADRIDFYRIGSSVDLLRRAQSVPGVVIRQSPDRSYNHITFNGAPGAVLADVRLRRAVAKGIDRTAIARRLIGQIVPQATQHGNHIYAFGSKDYQDNAGVLPYDQTAANRELDELGWARPAPDQPRAKDGRPLRLRLLEPGPNPVGAEIDRAVVEQLAEIGVAAVVEPVPIAAAQRQYLAGNFDLVGFAWGNTPTPFSSGRGIYAAQRGGDVQQNYGRITSPEIVALFDQGIRELDDAKRAELGNRVDRLIWEQVHHLPLYPSTGAYAVRSTLANFGAPGFADIDYINAGFVT